MSSPLIFCLLYLLFLIYKHISNLSAHVFWVIPFGNRIYVLSHYCISSLSLYFKSLWSPLRDIFIDFAHNHSLGIETRKISKQLCVSDPYYVTRETFSLEIQKDTTVYNFVLFCFKQILWLSLALIAEGSM